MLLVSLVLVLLLVLLVLPVLLVRLVLLALLYDHNSGLFVHGTLRVKLKTQGSTKDVEVNKTPKCLTQIINTKI
jgi:hypothetical protein